MKLYKIQDINKLTPAMQQYANLKNKHSDALLFFRMGDFYELFFDDAVITSKELNITLTKRGKFLNEDIPMCGIPFHALNNYIPRLIKKGYEIAICEQTSTPGEMLLKGIKGPLSRKVTRIITPGTLIEEEHLETKQFNFLACLTINNFDFSLSWLDVSTGIFLTNFYQYKTKEELKYKIENIINKVSPSELIIPDDLDPYFYKLNGKMKIKKINNQNFSYEQNLGRVEDYFKGFNLNKEFHPLQIITSGLLIYYLTLTFQGDFPRLRTLKSDNSNLFLEIDKSTISSLEIVQSSSGEKFNSLLDIMDNTETPAGSRLLKDRLLTPSCDCKEIWRRQNLAKFFILDDVFRDEIKNNLKKITDFERSFSRISLDKINPKELLFLGENLNTISTIKKKFKTIKKINNPEIEILIDKLKVDKALVSEIINAIRSDISSNNQIDDFIKDGYNQELDKIKNVKNNFSSKLVKLEKEYSNLTEIGSLKVKFNKVLGYHVEIRTKHLAKIKSFEKFIHRQTTAQTLRYTTKELLFLEKEINESSFLSTELEKKIYFLLRRKLLEQRAMIFNVSEIISELDISIMTAEQKLFKNYVIPEVINENYLSIKNGRHPVLELSNLTPISDFTSNNCEMNFGDIWLITGPNMAGKSTFLRQNALIIILAQAGLFVPAEKATVGIFDKIFSRVGASDDLQKGQSTFMVEMLETASILNRATEKSFIIFDEVGRGTSTYDGLSIAWAIIDYLLKKIRAKVLFATHYHELTHLKDNSKNIKNFKMNIKEWEDKIIFLYKIIPGESARSYGIEVARIAGLPNELIKVANKTLESFEKKFKTNKKFSYVETNFINNKNSELESYISKLNPVNLTPLQALQEIFKIKKFVKHIKK